MKKLIPILLSVIATASEASQLQVSTIIFNGDISTGNSSEIYSVEHDKETGSGYVFLRSGSKRYGEPGVDALIDNKVLRQSGLSRQDLLNAANQNESNTTIWVTKDSSGRVIMVKLLDRPMEIAEGLSQFELERRRIDEANKNQSSIAR